MIRMFGRGNKQQNEVTISNNTILRVIGFVVATYALLAFLSEARTALTLIFISFFLSMALNPAVSWLSHRLKGKSRSKATAVAYLVVVSVLVAFFLLVVPPLVAQTSEFIRDVPQTLRELKEDQGAVGDFVRRYELEEQVSQIAKDWSTNIGAVQGPAVSVANRVASSLVGIVTVFVLTAMMLIEGPAWLRAMWRMYPEKRNREHAQKLSGQMYEIVTSYVNGQVIVAAIGAGFSVVALFIATTLLDVSGINPVALGGIVFLFSLIPTIGATLAAVIVVLFSLFASPTLAIIILIYFIVYQQIENATVQPYIQSKGIGLTPMAVFLTTILGVGLGGILGAFLAIPFVACLRLLLVDYFKVDISIESDAQEMPKTPDKAH